MDKLKIVLDILKKHHFWVLVALVLLLGLSIYMAAAADLRGQYTKRVKVIETASEATDGIAAQVDHPNEGKIANWKTKKEQQEQKVDEAWRKLYEQQKASNPWPTKLGPKFLAKIEKLGPKKEIPSDYCEIYWNAIEKALPELLETVDYRRYVPIKPGEKTETGRAGSTGRMGPTGRLGDLPGANQENMKLVGTIDWKTHQLIRDQFNWSAIPTSARVHLAQEDYWVYQALLTIISHTNGDAKTHADAAIKEIVALQIGKAAASYIASNKPSIMPDAGVGTPGSGMVGAVEGSPSMTAPGQGPDVGMLPIGAASGTPSVGIEDMLLNGRYVDSEMKPLPAEETKNSRPYAEFRMMPVVMVLVIDQRKIPELLVECANSTMPVEPVQVRINPGKVQAGGFGPSGMGGGMLHGPTGMEGMGSGMQPMGMGVGGPEMGMGTMGPTTGMGPGMGGTGLSMGGMGPSLGGMGPGSGMGQLGVEDEDASPYEVTVEIRGIIYIYNPPPEPRTDLSTGESSD